MRAGLLARRIFKRKRSIQSVETGLENAKAQLGSEFLQSRKSMARMVENKLDVEKLGAELDKLAQRCDVEKHEYADLIKECAKARALSVGRRIHSFLVEKSMKDHFLANCLVNMYSKCRSMEEACEVFDGIPFRNVVSWNIMINAYVYNGEHSKAVETFRKMEAEGVKPSHVSFLLVVGACTSAGNLKAGAALHTRISTELGDMPVHVRSALINMYGKLGALDSARSVFEGMRVRTSGCWNCMISAYVNHGKAMEALELFHRMDVEPDEVTFMSALDACSRVGDVVQGRLVHSRVYGRFLGSELVNTALVNMYGKCGSVEDARAVFENMSPRQDVVAWTAMITTYVQQGYSRDALVIYQKMAQDGVKPDGIVFGSVLDACANIGDLKLGKIVHGRIVRDGYEHDSFVTAALLNLYRRCGSLQDARNAFGKIQGDERVPWNSMISTFCEQGNHYEALQVFRRMDLEGIKGDKVTLNSVLAAFSSPMYLAEGRAVHERGITIGIGEESIGIALVKMYGQCKSVEDARAVFERLPSKDVVAWSVIIGAYSVEGNCHEAMELYRQMMDAGVQPNEVTLTSLLEACANTGELNYGKEIHAQVVADGYDQEMIVVTAVVNMYAKCGDLASARSVFGGIAQRDIIAYTAMLTAYVLHEKYEEALELYYTLEPEGMKPDKVTYLTALEASTGLSALKHGRSIHASIEANGFDRDICVGNAVISLYGKCGSLKDARKFFDRMVWRDVVSWNSMVAAYAQHGHEYAVLDLFEKMKLDGVEPDVVTFVSILFACSHAGLLHEAYDHFASISGDFGLEPIKEHYSCMIDLLGRVGDLETAEKVIGKMSDPPQAVWMALMAACRTHGDFKRASRAAKRASELDPMSVAPDVLLSNIFVEGGRG